MACRICGAEIEQYRTYEHYWIYHREYLTGRIRLGNIKTAREKLHRRFE